MAFTRKFLDVELSLQNGNFGSGGNKLYKSGLRISAKIIQPGAPDYGQMQCGIFGLSLSEMNQLSTMGKQFNLRGQNTIKLYAYEEGQTPNLAFTGTISEAFADMQAAPAACFRVAAHAGLVGAIKPVEPTSVRGPIKVEDLMKQICQKGGWQFENNGVDTVLTNPYLPGAAYRQAVDVMKSARCLMHIHNDKLAIWKPGGFRAGSVPLISPQTGMVGYPRYRSSALEVTTAFNPQVQFGGKVKIQSDLTPACGEWTVVLLDHELESETPQGRWFSNIEMGPIAIS